MVVPCWFVRCAVFRIAKICVSVAGALSPEDEFNLSSILIIFYIVVTISLLVIVVMSFTPCSILIILIGCHYTAKGFQT